MSNAENRAFELLAIAEKQQLEIQAELAAIQHNNERLKTQLAAAIKQASEHSAELTARKIEARAEKAIEGFDRIKWIHYAYATGGMFLFVLFITMFSILWIPSFDEIAERRATAEKYGVDIKNVNGKYAVHIMSQQCYALNGSTVKDWCVIDPK
jgi:hypothetical protein